jgi:hypothetical protein
MTGVRRRLAVTLNTMSSRHGTVTPISAKDMCAGCSSNGRAWRRRSASEAARQPTFRSPRQRRRWTGDRHRARSLLREGGSDRRVASLLRLAGDDPVLEIDLPRARPRAVHSSLERTPLSCRHHFRQNPSPCDHAPGTARGSPLMVSSGRRLVQQVSDGGLCRHTRRDGCRARVLLRRCSRPALLDAGAVEDVDTRLGNDIRHGWVPLKVSTAAASGQYVVGAGPVVRRRRRRRTTAMRVAPTNRGGASSLSIPPTRQAARSPVTSRSSSQEGGAARRGQQVVSVTVV